jgi:hypothetical protein
MLHIHTAFATLLQQKRKGVWPMELKHNELLQIEELESRLEMEVTDAEGDPSCEATCECGIKIPV